MTPEPDGGFYRESGVVPFIRKFGYPDRKGRQDRMNFGGVHKVAKPHHLTNLTLEQIGYDPIHPGKWSPDGMLALLTSSGDVAASWSFAGLLKHWNRKHAKAVFVRSIRRKNGEQKYRFGKTISLGIGTDFSLFLKAFHEDLLYYDPGIKLEQASSTNPKQKRRSQFRVKSGDLRVLYREFRDVDVTAE